MTIFSSCITYSSYPFHPSFHFAASCSASSSLTVDFVPSSLTSCSSWQGFAPSYCTCSELVYCRHLHSYPSYHASVHSASCVHSASFAWHFDYSLYDPSCYSSVEDCWRFPSL